MTDLTDQTIDLDCTTFDEMNETKDYQAFLAILDKHFQPKDAAIVQQIGTKLDYLWQEMRDILENKESYQANKVADPKVLDQRIQSLLTFVETTTKSSFHRIIILWGIYYEVNLHNQPYYNALTFEGLKSLRFRVFAANHYFRSESFGVNVDSLLN